MNRTPDSCQQSAGAIAATQVDVAVIGAGPAGGSAALRLAAAGRSVLLLDRQTFPRDKVCGGGLLLDAQNALERLHLLDRVRAKARAFDSLLMLSPRGIPMHVPGDFLVLRRRDLDHIIAQAAVEAGADFHHAEVDAVDPQPDGSIQVRIAGRQPIHARVAIIATGARLRLLRAHGPDPHPAPTAVAIAGEIKSTYHVPTMTFSLSPKLRNGYAWIFPLGDGWYNVGCGTLFRRRRRDPALQDAFQIFTRTFQPLRCLLNSAGEQTAMRSAPLRCGLTAAAAKRPGNLLAIGETIAATLPLSGEGIGKAIRTAELAADLIEDAFRCHNFQRLERFPAVLQREIGAAYRHYARAQRLITLPWINDFMARRYQRSNYLKTCFAGLLSENVKPTELFSLQAILRSLFQ